MPGNGLALGHEARSTLVDRISLRETDSEDRNRQRRQDEEAYRQQVEQRAHEARRRRVHFEHRTGELKGEEHQRREFEGAARERNADRADRTERSDRSELRSEGRIRSDRAERGDGVEREREHLRADTRREVDRDRGGRRSDHPRDRGTPVPIDSDHGRQSILRATSGIDRAAQLLLRGQGPEAHLVLSREAMEARSASRGFDRRDPMARVLSALAANMHVRSEAVRTTVPADARRLAARMEQIARATETRADNLATAGSTRDAHLLRNVATDSRLQAALMRCAASNLDALLGRALARVLSGVVKESSPKSELNLDRALLDLDRAIEEERIPFHRLLQKDEARGKKKTPDAKRAVDILRRNERTRPLLDPLRELSIAICRGDPKATAAARTSILDALARTGQLPHLERVLANLPNARVTSSAVELLEEGLPRLLLDGIKNGTIKDLVKNGGLEPWLKSLPGMSKGSRMLLPGEVALASRGAPMLPSDLGPIEALLLGGPSLHSAQGTVTAYLSQKGLDTVPASFAGDPQAIFMLPPAARHENAVLLAPDGAIMVRTDEGPLFYRGHLTGADEQRYYYNTVPLDEELRRVMYQSASDPSHRHVRIDMGVDRIFDERDEGEELPSRTKRRKKVEQGEAPENLVAVAIFDGTPAPSSPFQGFATRFSARVAQDEIERANESLTEESRIGHLYLDYAADAGARLAQMGYPNTDAFQSALDAALDARGFDGESVGALILIAPEAGSIPNVPRPDPKDPELLQESLVLYPASVIID